MKKPDAQLNFVLGEFEKRGRRVEPMAAQQLVSVLGGKTGELAAMCEQLCFDFDDNPMGLDCVNQYLTANRRSPVLRGRQGRGRQNRRSHRHDACSCGTRDRSHRVDRRVGHEAPYHCQSLGGPGRHDFTGRSENQSVGAEECDAPTWRLDSAGLAHCIRMLAWADEQAKRTAATRYMRWNAALKTSVIKVGKSR